MKKASRWKTSVLSEAEEAEVQLPWSRGQRRSAWKAQVAARVLAKDSLRPE